MPAPYRSATLSIARVMEGIRAIADDSTAKHADRLRAYELLGKYLRLFTEKVAQDSKITVIVERIGGEPRQSFHTVRCARRKSALKPRSSLSKT